jgi:hypothetical protein
LRQNSVALVKCAVLEDRAGRLVDVFGDRQIVKAGLAGAGAAAQMAGALVGDTPVPGEDVDLVLVTIRNRFAFARIEIEEHFDGHDDLLDSKKREQDVVDQFDLGRRETMLSVTSMPSSW